MNHLWPGDLDVIALGHGVADIGAHIGAALALSHPHADRNTGFQWRRFQRGVVKARKYFRLPIAQEVGFSRQRTETGMGHSDRAQMPALGLRGHVEAHCALRHRSMGFGTVMRRRMDAIADALGHQCVIARMELDGVDAIAPAVHHPQARRVLVCNPSKLKRFRRAEIPSASRKRDGIKAIQIRRIDQRSI